MQRKLRQIAFHSRYTDQMYFKPVSRTLLLALAGSLFAHSAFAQWQWLDKDGRKVFSDRSPPAEIQDKNILKRPAGSSKPAPAPELAADAAAGSAKPANAASAPANKASAPKLTGKDAELEAKKKKTEEEEVSRKKVEEEKLAKTKVDNCDRAKGSMATLQSGVRLSSVNAKGEREVFDDTKRASEAKRAQEAMDANCK